MVIALRQALILEGDAEEARIERPGDLLGEGSYGAVYKCRDIVTGNFRAVKVVSAAGASKAVSHEATVLQNLDHPHILRIFSCFEDVGKLHIVTEYCAGGDLFHAVDTSRRAGRRMHESWAAKGLRQVFQAIAYCHHRQIAHKDLKSSNLLLLHAAEPDKTIFQRPPHVIVADWGLAEHCGSGPGWFSVERRGTQVSGTTSTMAPEVWSGNCGTKCDMWSMGCVLFQILSGSLPFKELVTFDNAQWMAILRRGPDWSRLHASPEATSLCKSLLSVPEKQRPAAKACTSHSWFKRWERHESECDSEDSQSESDDILFTIAPALCKWSRDGELCKALCLKIAGGQSFKGLDSLAKVFLDLDVDCDGVWNHQEIKRALNHIRVSSKSSVAAALDYKHDGQCEFLEFVAACIQGLLEFPDLVAAEFRSLHQRTLRHRERTADNFLYKLRSIVSCRHVDFSTLPANIGSVTISEFCAAFQLDEVVARALQNADVEAGHAEADGSEQLPLRHVGTGGSVSTKLSKLKFATQTSNGSTTSGGAQRARYDSATTATTAAFPTSVDAVFYSSQGASSSPLPTRRAGGDADRYVSGNGRSNGSSSSSSSRSQRSSSSSSSSSASSDPGSSSKRPNLPGSGGCRESKLKGTGKPKLHEAVANAKRPPESELPASTGEPEHLNDFTGTDSSSRLELEPTLHRSQGVMTPMSSMLSSGTSSPFEDAGGPRKNRVRPVMRL
mmetsp:Transcript_38182/g.89573  ORF Transcript_38182/g.89573 Transcript_38182/m.89573 type:complete len:727 (-) Transcript_38182:50-2230(-)